MTVEILPVGIKCNLKCTYCYQEPMRDAGNFGAPIKFHKMIEALDRVGTDFSLFGGEALLTPMETLEKFFDYGYKRYKRNGIQTNGLLINDAHIGLFKKYNVQVGVSIDGPEGLNLPRCPDSDTRTIIDNIRNLSRNHVSFSLIVTIHKTNAARLPELLAFFGDIGAQHVNLHNLEDDNCSGEALSNDDNLEVFKQLYDYSKSSGMSFAPFGDIKLLLTEVGPNVSCIWNTCDSLNTQAVHGISPDGQLTNCGRTNKDGIDWLKADTRGFERYQALYHTPQEYGGCKDCKYFYACKGQCPGTAIDGDWRNRTKDCSFWYRLIEHIERDLISSAIQVISDERKFQLGQVLALGESSHGDSPHADNPHGDSHGDHTDSVLVNYFEQAIASGQAVLVER